MAEKTVVDYDVSKAMAEIGRLENRIKELESKTKRSFDKMGSSSEALEKGLKGINAPAGSVVENVRKLTAGINPMSIAIGASAGSVAQLLGEIVELPAALRSTEERVKALTDGIERAAEIAKAGIKLRASVDAVNIEERLEAIDLRRAANTEERVEVTERRDVLKDKLEEEKNYLNSRKALVQAANRDISRLEDLASGIRDKRFQRGLEGKDLNQQLDALLSRAAKLRGAGGQENLQRAERLIDQASDLAAGKGDHRDVSRVAAEEGRLLQVIDESVKARREQAGAEAAVDRASKDRISNLEKEIKLLTQRATSIRNDNKLLQAKATVARVEAGDVREREGQETSIKDRQASLQAAFARFTAQRDAVTSLKDFGKRGLALSTDIFSDEGIQKQQQQVNRAKALAAGAFGNLSKGTAGGNAEAEKFLQALNATITKLESGKGVAGALQFDVANLKAGAEFLDKVVAADEKFVQSRGSTERFSLGAVNEEATKYAESLERAAAARERLATPIPGLGLAPVAPNSPSSAPAAPSLPAAPGGAASPGNTTVNINVKGGIIDPAVSRAIGDEVQRQLRRRTQSSSGSGGGEE
jgi:chromosome segregation ATPase